MSRAIACLMALLTVGASALAAPALPALDEAAPHDRVDSDAYNLTATYGKLAPGAEVALIFDQQAPTERHLVRATTQRTQLLRASGGKTAPLASGQGLGVAGEGTVLTVMRRPGHVRVYAGPVLLAAAYDASPAGGDCGSAAGAKVTRPTDLTVQETGPIDFEDDFFAGDERTEAWEARSGKFAVGVYWDPKQKLDDRPIGASWYATEGPGDHLTVAGEDFWDDYAAEVSVLPTEGSSVGLAGRVHDARNYAAIMLSPGSGPAEAVARLIEVIDGQERVLAESHGSWPAAHWHRCRVEVAGDWASATVDGQAVGEGRLTGRPWGRVGLLATTTGEVRFDDATVHSIRRLAAASGAQPVGPWAFASGAWSAAKGRLTCRAASRAVALAEVGDWPDCRVQAQLSRPSEADAGLVARWSTDGGYAFLARREADALHCVIARLGAPGEQTVLGEGEALSDGDTAILALVANGSALRGFVNGVCVAKAWDTAFPSGRVGLISSRGQTTFAGFQATAPPREETVEVLVEDGTGRTRPGAEHGLFDRFLGDLWRPRSGEPRLTELNGEPCFSMRESTLRFYAVRPGDVSVSVDVLETDEKPVALAICTQSGDQPVGYRLALEGDALELTRSGQVVASATTTRDPSAPLRLTVWRDGPFVIGQAGPGLVTFRDQEPLDSGHAEVQAEGRAVLDNLALRSAHTLAYRFDRVEPDWAAASGEWTFHSGMACIPWAYWLTGDGRTEPAFTWSRYRAPADVAVSLDVSEYTEGYDNDDHRHFPYHDLNLVLASQQRTPDSGYRFVIGAEGGRLLRLYRNGTLVKESSDSRFAVVMGGHCNAPRAMEVYAFKQGGSLRLVLQGLEAMAYEDPEPLGAGAVGLGVEKCRANVRDLFLYRDQTWALPVGAAQFEPEPG